MDSGGDIMVKVATWASCETTSHFGRNSVAMASEGHDRRVLLGSWRTYACGSAGCTLRPVSADRSALRGSAPSYGKARPAVVSCRC